MNFHKTIGFLAALLLMVGLGAPDSFAQTITLSAPTPASITEDDGEQAVTVSVTVAPAPATGTTVEVAVVATLNGSTIGTANIEVTDGNATEGEIMVTPPVDDDTDNTNATLTASLAGHTSDTQGLTITDSDELLTVTLTPDGGSAGDLIDEGATAVTVAVEVDLVESSTDATSIRSRLAAPETENLVVNVSIDPGMTGASATGIAVTVTSTATGTGNLIITVPEDDDNAFNEAITVTAAAAVITDQAKYKSGTATQTIQDNEYGISLAFQNAGLEEVNEQDANQDVIVTVTLNRNVEADDSPVTVTVIATNSAKGVQIASDEVEITTGSATGTATLSTPTNDADATNDELTITASGDGLLAPEEDLTLTVLDDDKGQGLTLTLDPTSLNEGRGTQAVTVVASLTNAPGATAPVVVTAESGTTITGTEIGGGSSEIGAAATAVTVVLMIPAPDDEDVADPPRTIPVTATATVTEAGDPVEYTASASLMVMDDDKMTLSLDPASLDEMDTAQDVDVMVTLEVAASGDVAVTIAGGGGSVDVTIDDGMTTGSGTLSVMTNDADTNNDELTVTATAMGYVADTAQLMVTDDDGVQASLALALSPSSVNDDAGDTEVMVTATVNLGGTATAATPVVVTLTVDDQASDHTAESADYTITNLSSFTVTVPADHTGPYEGTGTFNIDPNEDGDNDSEVIVIKGMATIGGTSVTASQNLTLNDGVVGELAKNAVDASGFRLTIASPGAGKWAKVGKNQVKVQLHRRAGLASDFGRYSSIEVSLFDENIGHDDDNEPTGSALYSISVGDDDAQLSALALASVETDSLATVTGSASVGTPNATTNIVAYERRTRTGKYDVLEFRFNIPNPTPDALGPNNLVKTYAVATFISGGLDASGDDVTASIESRDTETTIYPGNPSAFPDKVGDGKLVMIDRDPPLKTVITALAVSITDKNDIGGGTNAGIGDEIELTGELGASFRDHSVVYHIIVPQAAMVGDDVVIKANEALVGYSETFPAVDVFDAINAGDPLSDKFKVTQNQFKRKYTAKDPRDEPKFAKNDTREDDQMSVRARAQVKDVAGNATTQTAMSTVFTLDSKPPKVKILYPKPSAPDSNRFTAKVQQLGVEFIGEGEQDVDLNPLKFSVDEGVFTADDLAAVGGSASAIPTDDLATPYVVIQGNNDARLDTLLLSGVESGANEIDLSAGVHKHRFYIRPSNGKADGGKASADNYYRTGTKTAKVTVAVTDLSGNTGKATPDGGDPIFDNKPPLLSRLFPNTANLEPYDLKIGGPEGTQHPVFRLNEAVDSILARYEGGGDILEVAGTDAQNSTVNNNIRIRFMGDNALRDGEVYDLQVYVRDLAGNVTVSDRQNDLTFEESLSNPAAGAFKLATLVRTYKTADQFDMDKGHVKMDSVVANQGMRLDITALDAALSESAGEDRVAITYAKSGVKVVVMDSDGNPEPTAKFWGGASGNGTATLNDLGWSGGERSIFFRVTNAGSYTVAVKDMNADGTVNFMKTTDIVVDAADFQKFVITASDDDFDPADSGTVWEDFDLTVTPTDDYGNASLKSFHNFTGIGKVNPVAAQDSLDILDTRVEKTAPAPENAGNSTKKYTHVDVNFATSLIEDLPFSWSVAQAGDTFSVRTQEGRTRGTARVRAIVDNDFFSITELRSRNRSGEASFTIQQPVDISITLWVPGKEGDQAGQTVEIPAGGTVAVTARAEGLNEGDSVTFNVDGEETEATADADGYAGQPITLTGSGTVSVTATSGQNSESLEVVYEEQSGRMAFVDANGDPVYLVDLSDNTVDQNDIMAFVIAYLSDAGESNYNPQADANDDGTVDDDDLALIVTSWLKTAVNGPATKPLVLAPGVNQNAEFALSLGSERVVAGELVAVDVSLTNVEALMGYGFNLNYDAEKFEFVSVGPTDEDLLKSTGGETLFHHVATDGQVQVVTGLYNGTAVSGGGDIARFVFRVLYEFEDNARFEVANGLVFDPSQLTNPAVVAGVLELQSTPREFALHQNFPNPFNPDTTIKYDLAESADVTLQIYNVLGQVVRTLVASEAQNAGRYQIRWNGMDERGVPVSSGIYFYQISADGKFSDVRKLMLLK